MLVLDRRRKERIIIDSEIVVQVLSIKGRNVEMGIICPKNISVLKDEIYKKIKKGEKNGIASKEA